MTAMEVRMSVWTARFVFFVGMMLVVSSILIASQALSATTIWYVLVPGTAIGLTLAATGMLGIQVAKEFSAESKTHAIASHMSLGLALGTGCGVSVGTLTGNLAMGISFGTLLGFPIGLALCLTARPLTRR